MIHILMAKMVKFNPQMPVFVEKKVIGHSIFSPVQAGLEVTPEMTH